MADVIERVETYCLQLPYKFTVHFKSVTESSGPYILLRLVTKDGAEGIAEAIARPEQYSENPRLLASNMETFFKPMLIGADPLEINAILAKTLKLKFFNTERSLIDTALWDLKGKLMGQPVWKILGGSKCEGMPVTWIVHGNSKADMIKEALRVVNERGFTSLKVKCWRRTMEDVEMIRDMRKELGDKILIYVDANGAYTEAEARAILSRLVDYNIALVEDPCELDDPARIARLAQALPIPILGDDYCRDADDIKKLCAVGAIGAASVKPRRNGITGTIKAAHYCEINRIPAIFGTDSESRIGALVRSNLWAGIPHLQDWPAQTHFFEKLADDVFEGDFTFKNGLVSVPDKPGFGASIDQAKLRKYSLHNQ
jgi:L-alanine-DL-glutamate epimerase-like enolase superfamily enzyme